MVFDPCTFIIEHFLCDQVLEIIYVCLLREANLLVYKCRLYLSNHVCATIHILELRYVVHINRLVGMHERLVVHLAPHLFLKVPVAHFYSEQVVIIT